MDFYLYDEFWEPLFPLMYGVVFVIVVVNLLSIICLDFGCEDCYNSTDKWYCGVVVILINSVVAAV